MKFTSSQSSFELSVLGYGQQANNWRNRNKLQCEVQTVFRKESDKQIAPIQTYALAQLLNTIQLLRSRKVRHLSQLLSEDGLTMDITALADGKFKVQIQLNQVLTPSWNTYPDFPAEVEMTLNQRELNEFAEQLYQTVTMYPVR